MSTQPSNCHSMDTGSLFKAVYITCALPQLFAYLPMNVVTPHNTNKGAIVVELTYMDALYDNTHSPDPEVDHNTVENTLGMVDIVLCKHHHKEKHPRDCESDNFWRNLKLTGFKDLDEIHDKVKEILQECVVAVHDGVYWNKEFPNHEVSRFFKDRIDNFLTWTSTALQENQSKNSTRIDDRLKNLNQAAQSSYRQLIQRIEILEKKILDELKASWQKLQQEISQLANRVSKISTTMVITSRTTTTNDTVSRVSNHTTPQ
eukprot:9216176-Ditylum_brightwellii.AAC.2